MKTTLTILFTLTSFLVYSAYAQQTAVRGDASTAAAELRAQLGRHIPDFIRAQAQVDVLSRATTQTWVDTDWENSSQTRYSYEGGLLTEVLQLTWEENDWVNSGRTTNTYSGGLLITQENADWTDNAWVPTFRTVNSYEGNDLVETVYQDWVDGEWVNSDRTRIVSEGGVVTEWEEDVWDGADWALDGRSTMEESGADVVFTSQDWVESEWVNADRIIYTNTTVSELYEAFREFAEEIDVFIGYAFLFSFPDYVSQEWVDVDWENSTRLQTEYDDQDRPTMVTTDTWEEGEWVGAGRQVYMYDNGILESTELQSFEEGEWATYLTESYTYYDNGLLETVLHQFDFGTGAMNNTLITLEWTSAPSTSSENDDLPVAFKLEPVYPNPFNPTANVTYELASAADVTVSVYDVLGRHVATLADGLHAAGKYEVTFDAGDRPSGLYIIRLEAPSHRQSQTVSLIR